MIIGQMAVICSRELVGSRVGLLIVIFRWMIKLPKIGCLRENHGQMLYEYVCMHHKCLAQSNELACVYCCQELHRTHHQHLIALKQIAHDLEQTHNGKQQELPTRIIISGLSTCRNEQELRTNLREILALRRIEVLDDEVDRETAELNGRVARYYQRQQQAEMESTAIGMDEKGSVKPLVTFKESPTYVWHSPFQISAKQTKMVTAWAQPSLSTYKESVEMSIKIERSSPSWIGIGVSLGEAEYSQASDRHIMVLSNGWTNDRGKLAKSRVRLGKGSVLVLRWNKDQRLLLAEGSGEKLAFELQDSWNQQVYLCVCLFYEGDRISILN